MRSIPGAEAVRETLHFETAFKQADLVDFEGKVVATLPVEDRSTTVSVGPKRIITLALREVAS